MKELSIYEDTYEHLCELIDPHIKVTRFGLSSCNSDSLTTSVTDSVEHLLEFWLLNRDREGVEHP